MFIRAEVLGFSGLFSCSFDMLVRRAAELDLIILLFCVFHPTKNTALKPILCAVRLIDCRNQRVFRSGGNCPCPFPHLSARLAVPLKAEGHQPFLKMEGCVESEGELL